jgi:beta-1,2-mannobiose phosphorylase / 1,2-beta-oligomannan phosphorylase
VDLFQRFSGNPILSASSRWWESRAVFNPGAAVFGDLVALVYRAVGGDGLSRFGLAWSSDGLHIDERSELPFYESKLDDPLARLGVEDPRLTRLGDDYYLTYTKVSVDACTTPALYWETAPFRVRSALGVTRDFRAMTEIAGILPNANTKDTVLFPERIDGQYAALTRVFPAIQYLTSPDLVHWTEPIPCMTVIPDSWQGERIGAGPPPVRIPQGWLLLYHGNAFLQQYGNKRLYSMGLAVLDADEPWKVRYRSSEPIMTPEAPYEVAGPVGNVVFGTGLVEIEEKYFLYYGAGDGVIGVATADKKVVLEYVEEGLRGSQ